MPAPRVERPHAVVFGNALSSVDPNAPVLNQLRVGGVLVGVQPGVGPGQYGDGGGADGMMFAGSFSGYADSKLPPIPTSTSGLVPETDPMFHSSSRDPSMFSNSPMYPHIFNGVPLANTAPTYKGNSPYHDSYNSPIETVTSLRMQGP